MNPSVISTVSVSSIHNTIHDSVSLGYETQNGGYTNIILEPNTGSLESENTVTPYQFINSFSREPPVLCEESNTSMSFDLLSLQSLDHCHLSSGGMAIIRDTNAYICHDSSIV